VLPFASAASRFPPATVALVKQMNALAPQIEGDGFANA
jgi:hypothetical protein